MTMELDKLKHKWKEETDMHPSIEYDRDRVAKALNLKGREVDHFWIAPLFTILGLLAAIYLLWPESVAELAVLPVITVAATLGLNVYFLYRYRQFVKGRSTRPPFQNLLVKTRLMEQFFGGIGLLLVGISLYDIAVSQESWQAVAGDSWLVWLYAFVFIQQYFRYRNSRKKLGRITKEGKEADHYSWAEEVEAENRKILRRSRWFLGIAAVGTLLYAVAWMLGYTGEDTIGYFLGGLFVVVFVAFEYYRRKQLLEQ